jgi:hypothetical protein
MLRILKIKAASSCNVGNEMLIYTMPHPKDRDIQTPYTFIDHSSFLYTTFGHDTHNVCQQVHDPLKYLKNSELMKFLQIYE